MKLFFRRIGEGAPLVILHGLLGSSDSWLSIGKHFAARYEVFIPDLRNHGHSPHSDVINYASLSEDILSFFDINNISSAFLLGHSMGGKVAMRFALDNVSRVDKLIVADIGIKKYSLNDVRYIQTMMGINFNFNESRKDVERLLTAQIPDERFVQLLLKNLEWKNNKKLGWRMNAEAICANIDNLLDSIISDNVYKKPALFIRGALSDYISDDDINDLINNFPLMKLETLPDSGHWLHVDNKNYFIDSIEKFLVE